MDSVKERIIKTLVYADIFDYPLKKDEIWRRLIGRKKVSRNLFEKSLKNFHLRDGFFYLPQRDNIIDKRIKREELSKRKFILAAQISIALSKIPSLYFIGISGSLAMKNVDEDDDIDFFIITSKNTLWISRFLCLIFLQILGKRRNRLDKKAKNKVCVNMIIDETAITLSSERHDLYTAYEIIQMMPLFEKNQIYRKFREANDWVKKYLPNSIDIKILGYKDIKSENRFYWISKILSFLIPFLEFPAKIIQLRYINRSKTIETVLDNFLAFHPLNYRDKVLSLYEKNLRKYRKI